MDAKSFMLFLDHNLRDYVEQYPSISMGRDTTNDGIMEWAKNRAFITWCLTHLAEYSDMDINEALEAVVDGAEDKGIDAIYIPDKGKKLLILQSKRYKDPEKKCVSKDDLVQLFNGCEWLLEGDLSSISNSNFCAKAEEFREAFSSYDYSSVLVVLAATANPLVTKEVRDEIELAKSRLQKRGMQFVINLYTINDLIQLYLSKVHQPYKINIKMNLMKNGTFYQNKLNTARACVGTVKGVELARLYNEFQHRLLSVNIRNSLGNVKINRGIQETAQNADEAQNFWFYNNGITFICDEFSFRDTTESTVKLENAQIINGAQTICSLWKVWQTAGASDEFNDVDVLVRIFEKKDDILFVQRVTLFTNSQNAVLQSDLVGTDTLQIELKKMLSREGVYYEIRRGDLEAEREEYQDRTGLKLTTWYSLKEAAQSLATVFIQIPAIAKSETSQLFIVQDDGGYYDKVFTPNMDAKHVILAVETLRTVYQIRKYYSNSFTTNSSSYFVGWLPTGYSQPPIWLPHADFFLTGLLSSCYYDPSRHSDLQYINRLLTWVKVKDTSFMEAYASIIQKVDESIKQNVNQYGFSFPKYFKNQSEYIKLTNLIGNNYYT